MMGKLEGNGERRRPNLTWIDSKKAAISMNLQELSSAVEYRTL